MSAIAEVVHRVDEVGVEEVRRRRENEVTMRAEVFAVRCRSNVSYCYQIRRRVHHCPRRLGVVAIDIVHRVDEEMVCPARRIPVRMRLTNVLHHRLHVRFVDVTSFRLLPPCPDPAVEEVAGGKEGDEEEVGVGVVCGVEGRVRMRGRGG
jgi:hypothetical protein